MLVPPAELVGRVKATIKECSVADARNCAGDDTLLIDIRELAEFERGHIPGAVLLPRGLLEFDRSVLRYRRTLGAGGGDHGSPRLPQRPFYVRRPRRVGRGPSAGGYTRLAYNLWL
jgi:rhodanese-related sulfurtransferase